MTFATRLRPRDDAPHKHQHLQQALQGGLHRRRTNQLTEQRIMADNTMSAEEKQERLAMEKADVERLVAVGDGKRIRDRMEQLTKTTVNDRQHEIPVHIAEHIAVAMEAAPTGSIYQEASVADSKEPGNTASAPKSKVTVVTL